MDRSSDRRTFLGRGALGITTAAVGLGAAGGVVPAVAAAALDGGGGVADVRTFGAVGDGSTDDTMAIQAAVDSLRADPTRPGGTVWFPPGTYLVSSSIVVDYATSLVGANPAASVVHMRSDVVADMFRGGDSFPVHVQFVNLTLDGGFDPTARDTVPVGTGTAHVVDRHLAGSVVHRVTVHAVQGGIGPGDVLRRAGHPPLVCTDVIRVPAGSERDLWVAAWSPAERLDDATTRWRVFGAGSLIARCGRVTVHNCRLRNAKRHAIELVGSTQGNIANCEIGDHQGCGLFGWESTDFAVADSWFYGGGGPHVFLNSAVDVRIHHSFFEGSCSRNIEAHWSEVEVDSCGLWGGRAGLIGAVECGVVRLTALKLRDPGYGAEAADSLSSSGYREVKGRPAISAHFAEEGSGLVATNCVLHHAITGTGPVVEIRNGSRSNLSQIEWAADITFLGGASPGQLLRDGGTDTIVRGFRGVPDSR